MFGKLYMYLSVKKDCDVRGRKWVKKKYKTAKINLMHVFRILVLLLNPEDLT